MSKTPRILSLANEKGLIQETYQEVLGWTQLTASETNAWAFSNAAIQPTDLDPVFSGIVFTPKYADSTIEIDASVTIGTNRSGTDNVISALFVNNVNVKVQMQNQPGSQRPQSQYLLHRLTPGSTSPITIMLRAGGNANGVLVTLNDFQPTTGSAFASAGGKCASWIRIREYRTNPNQS